MFQLRFCKNSDQVIKLFPVSNGSYPDFLGNLTDPQTTWLETAGFKPTTGSVCLVPATDQGQPFAVIGMPDDIDASIWDWASVSQSLPLGDYQICGNDLSVEQANNATLGWALAGYSFSRFKENYAEPKTVIRLVWPEAADQAHVLSTANATALVRDLINNPVSHMGPAELAGQACDLAGKHGAQCNVIVGDDLLSENYPAIHAVGRACDQAPRLIDLTWGDVNAPKVTLVGKGVCFDTGGLDIKPASGMKTMKKDMGGGAHVLGVAAMVMDANLPIRLRVLIPAVENSIAGNAMRPLDVVSTRKGLTIEIGHTDAEGRVVLADALAEAASENPDIIIDCATLTGAARVALGTELPALFCNDDGLAFDIIESGMEMNDPLWRMPLWQPYAKQVDGKVADVTNSPEGGYGGAITAALFLERFVSGADGAVPAWAHIDMMAWNLSSRPGRPEGGEAMGMRALFNCLKKRYDR